MVTSLLGWLATIYDMPSPPSPNKQAKGSAPKLNIGDVPSHSAGSQSKQKTTVYLCHPTETSDTETF